MNNMKMLKSTVVLLASIVSAVAVLQSCKSDPNSPGIEYMPDMYRSPTYEAYDPSPITDNGASAMKPVEGTIPMGFDNLPYPYPNTNEGYEAAGKQLKNPIPLTENVLEEAKVVYSNFCVHCHGKKGQGDGAVASNPKWPGAPPAYDSDNLKNLPEGKIFHSIHYGKGLMGSHASQISKTDRWKLVHYVQSLQGNDSEQAESANDEEVGEMTAAADSTATMDNSEATTE